MKKTIHCILAAFVLLILSACSGPMSGGEGSIVISLGAAGRAAYGPPADILEKIEYVITLTGSSTQTLTAKHGDTIRTAVIPGSWKIEGQAYLNMELYAEASVTADIKSGPNQIVLNMKLTGDEVISIPVSTFAQLQSEIGSFNSGDTDKTILIIADIAIDNTLFINNYAGNYLTIKGDIKNRTLSRFNFFGRLFEVNSGGLVLENIIIDGGNMGTPGPNYGSLVYVDKGAAFIMRDGAVLQNNKNDCGGGVYVVGDFFMEGGIISGNTAEYGGGVYVYEDGLFIMYDDSAVSGNTALPGSGSGGGGGVCVYKNGRFKMSGGAVSGNTAGSNQVGSTPANGGGVYVDENGYFEMNGGVIDRNTAAANGGGVYVIDGTFTKKGGGIIYGYDGITESNKANDGFSLTYGQAVYFEGSIPLGTMTPKHRDTTLNENDDISTDTNPNWGI